MLPGTRTSVHIGKEVEQTRKGRVDCNDNNLWFLRFLQRWLHTVWLIAVEFIRYLATYSISTSWWQTTAWFVGENAGQLPYPLILNLSLYNFEGCDMDRSTRRVQVSGTKTSTVLSVLLLLTCPTKGTALFKNPCLSWKLQASKLYN